MPFASVNAQRLFYEDTGGTHPAIAFSHGLLMDHTMFAPQIASLRDRYRCIAWDERGHGETGQAAERLDPFTYWDSAEDLASLLDQLGIARAVLVGMSQGGFLSLRFALRHPDRVRALIFIDSQAGPENPDTLPGYMALTDRWAADGPSPEILAVPESILFGQGWPGAPAWLDRWSRLKRAHLRPCMETLAGREDLTDRLGEIHVPTLVIHGDADAAIPLERGRQLADGLRGELVVIPGAGHSPNLTHPALTNQAIETFLARLPA